ncbi:MAG: chorismate synthase [Prevotellaceae bacterium]|nr:chorismate synthase [Prevotellaceae bacterium]
MNTFGEVFRLTTFGESHGLGVGGVVDGMPAGVAIDPAFIQQELSRRRPGQSPLTTQRSELDEVELLSGVFEGQSTGQPIGFLVRNTDHRSQDYEELRHVFRPSHADYTYQMKYGLRDHRGGGRSSARETLSRVVGGALAKLALRGTGISIDAYTEQVGDVRLGLGLESLDLSLREGNDVRCPDPSAAALMAERIREAKARGDTVGGVVAAVVRHCPAGLGDPVFGKLQARLAGAMMSINAAKGFEYGLGFAGVSGSGSQQNDAFIPDGRGGITTLTNRSGGIQGGISNGQDIYFRVAFKPVATLLMEQETVDDEGNPTVLKARGRHDPCVVPRAVPVVEAMAAMVLLDCLLLNKTVRV